ncbi:coiled-coil domain-containing protein 8 [Eumetopias jubatus]|uniref:coiled-coil domain-containing protein 8 n=1 Tax=Eumetopias jubatus TaxID=34886 RepID=UPI001015D0CD|nr:coiled-coil domain-containing protein 8 [Eumetopias jubatus]
MLQIGEDVDYLLIPREVRLAGGVWRVISKPATKEAEFRERLTQFLEEEGRTLEDVARIIEKSTPHPPQPPKKPKEPQVRRRVQQMVTPPPRLVVGTYDSSNASDSEFSDFETSRDKSDKSDKGHKGAGRSRKVRKMPVSYLGSKFLGSDLESEDDEELVEAFLQRGEKKPSAPPARRRVNLPVPMFEDNPRPQLSKADRWREYVSQVSWGKLKRRVKGWAPRSSPEGSEAQQAFPRLERVGASGPGRASQGHNVGNTEDGQGPETPPRRWKPKIKWASFRRRRREEAASTDQGTGAAGDQRAEAADDQRAEAADDQRAEAADDQRVEAVDNQRAEAADDQRAEAADDQGAEAADDQGAEAADNQGVEAIDNQRAEAIPAQGAEAEDNPGAEAIAVQRAEAANNQREGAADNQRAEAPVVQEAEAASDGAEAIADQRAEAVQNQRAEAPAARGAIGTTQGAKARKQVKTVRFQTPGRFSWFRKHRRAFWHTPRLPTLPKRVPRAGEARSLRVLRAEARAEAEQGEREDQL